MNTPLYRIGSNILLLEGLVSNASGAILTLWPFTMYLLNCHSSSTIMMNRPLYPNCPDIPVGLLSNASGTILTVVVYHLFTVTGSMNLYRLYRTFYNNDHPFNGVIPADHAAPLSGGHHDKRVPKLCCKQQYHTSTSPMNRAL